MELLARSSVVSDEGASAGGTILFPSGIPVESGRTVCLSVQGLSLSMLHGYLTKDK
jgi:hypothetical protein